MKKNKLYLLSLFLIVISSYSCNKSFELEDDIIENQEVLSPVYGEWVPKLKVRVCSSGNTEIIQLSDCIQESRLNFTNDNFNWNVYAGNNLNCYNLINYSGSYNLIENEETLSLWKYDETGELVRYYSYVVLTNKKTLLLGNSSNCDCDGGYDMIRQYIEYTRVEK